MSYLQQIGTIAPVWWSSWQPWHLAIVLSVLCLGGYWLARIQLNRSREDFADAYFYSPSQKGLRRRRLRRWQDVCRVLLALALLCLGAALTLYVRPPG